jgi:hypothetical protein
MLISAFASHLSDVRNKTLVSSLNPPAQVTVNLLKEQQDSGPKIEQHTPIERAKVRADKVSGVEKR